LYGVRLNLAEFLGDLSMHKKISLLLLLSTSLVISADHHALKGDKSNKEKKKMEMEKRGMWKPEDCKKISQTSGAYLYFSGEAFKKRSSLEKDGNQIDAEKAFSEARALAELAANFAKNFEAYCKKQ
tara:strand:+ start:106 stop:486 length:381 start_codon:yes stop_codon:yes gene_type:complete